MLYLISLGIWDEKDISLKGREAGKSCEKLYWEQYTTRMNTNLERAQQIRDNPKALAKDVLSAIKEINLMLGSRSPEKQTVATAKAGIAQQFQKTEKPEMSSELKGKLAKLKE